MLSALGDLAGWLGSVWDQIRAIQARYIVAACLMQAGQTVLNGLAWRNILRAAYPRADVPTRPIVAAYAGGTGLNAVLPAQAGTVAYLGLFRSVIPGSRMVTITAGAVAQNLFYAIVSVGIYAYLFLGRPAARNHSERTVSHHSAFWLIVLAIAVVLALLIGRTYWRRLRGFWAHAKEGATILGTPLRYLRQVVTLQAGSYALRLGVNATLMAGVGIPVSPRNVLLIVAANSISSTISVTPGGLGTQQALASTVLHGVAPATRVTAYSLAQQTILMAFNLAFGLAILATVFGLSRARHVIAASRHESQTATPTDPDEDAPDARQR